MLENETKQTKKVKTKRRVTKKIPSEVRRSKGILQDEMAKRCGVTYQTISNWERGFTFPPKTKWKVIEEAYGVPFEQLDFGWGVETN